MSSPISSHSITLPPDLFTIQNPFTNEMVDLPVEIWEPDELPIIWVPRGNIRRSLAVRPYYLKNKDGHYLCDSQGNKQIATLSPSARKYKDGDNIVMGGKEYIFEMVYKDLFPGKKDDFDLHAYTKSKFPILFENTPNTDDDDIKE